MKLRTTPVITLTPEDRDFINRIEEFIGQFQHNVCNVVESCDCCPIRGACDQYVIGQPINIFYFLNDIEANALDEED